MLIVNTERVLIVKTTRLTHVITAEATSQKLILRNFAVFPRDNYYQPLEKPRPLTLSAIDHRSKMAKDMGKNILYLAIYGSG